MVISSAGLGTKNHCAGEDQQQVTLVYFIVNVLKRKVQIILLCKVEKDH
jgi:hypothetical protein